MNNILIHDKKTIKLMDRLLRSEFTINSNLPHLSDFSLLKDEWLTHIFIENITVSELLKFIRNKFKYVELYHSCAPSSLLPYYTHGLETLNIARIEKELASLLKEAITIDPHAFKIGLEKARAFIKEMDWRDEICFHTDKRRAIEQIGFSSFGGEYVVHIVSHIPSQMLKTKIHNILIHCGIPTLLTIRMPLEKLSDKDLRSYLNHFICIWIEIYLLKRFKFEDCSHNPITHNSKSIVIPSYIYRHEHPRSWLEARKPFYCDKCSRVIPKKNNKTS